MSLQVWLPLTKDLRQQGLSNATVTNNGATYSATGGKLGGCYNFTNNYCAINVSLGATASIACWTKTSTNGKMSWVLEDDTYGYLNLYEQDVYTLNAADSNNNPFKTGSNTNISCLHDGQWHHFVVTFGNNVAKLYIDGEYQGTAQTFRNPTTTNKRIKIGGYYKNAHSYSWNGAISDFRVYDHCLSPMEVKELAKGLVLHYPLSNDSIQQMNNCYNYPRFENSASSAGWNHWGGTGHIGTYGQSTDSNYIFRQGQTYTHWVANGTGATYNYLLYQSPAFEGGIRSLQCICKEENGVQITNNICYATWNARSGGTENNSWTSIIPLGNGFYWCKCENIQQDGSNDLVGIYIRPGYKVYFSECYLENDTEICSNPFYYSDIIYDCSGFCNNGSKWAYDTAGEIICANDTPKYKISTYINSSNNTTNTASGTQYIYGNCELTAPQYLTVAFWCKPIGGYGNQTGQGQFSLTKNAIGASAGEDYSACPMNHRDSYIDMCTSSGVHKTMGITFTANEWHHYVVVYDGRYGRVYKDGVATGQTLDMESVLPLKDMKGAVIGFSKAGGVWRSNKSYYSDFRIYATALSADDVKSLYQNCATIDPDGTIRGQIRS